MKTGVAFGRWKHPKRYFHLYSTIADINSTLVSQTTNITALEYEISTELPEGHVYEHQGISARRFLRTFTLADYVEVTSATNKDGILTIELERHIPEAMKPKTIAIAYE